MSSYYTTAELEQMRKAQIRRQLEQKLNALQAQLRAGGESTATVAAAAAAQTVAIQDDAQRGYTYTGSGPSVTERSTQPEARTVIDLSALLRVPTAPSKLSRQLEDTIRKADERAILTQADAQDKARLMTAISQITSDPNMDIEDKILAVQLRVQSFLQCGTPISAVDTQKLQDARLEYSALCRMLELTPQADLLPDQIRHENERMKQLLEKQAQQAYILQTLGEILEQLGCHVQGSAVLDHTEGQAFSVDGAPLCDVFVGADHSGILFEPIAQTRGGSLDRQRQTQQHANKICALYATLEEKALERGILLRRVYADPVDQDTICIQSDLEQFVQKKQQRKAQEQKKKRKKWSFDLWHFARYVHAARRSFSSAGSASRTTVRTAAAG